MVLGDATTWSVILMTRVVIYDRNIFIIQALEPVSETFDSRNLRSKLVCLYLSVSVISTLAINLLVITWVEKNLPCLYQVYIILTRSVKANMREPKTYLDRVFNYKLGCYDDMHILIYVDTCLHLHLKTQPRFCVLSAKVCPWSKSRCLWCRRTFMYTYKIITGPHFLIFSPAKSFVTLYFVN